jgi:hypothetical protein
LLRADYIYTIGTEYQAEQLIFLDESAKDERTLSRHYGYSFKNQVASQKIVFLRGVRYTILPALTLDGFIACDIMKGSCSKERFRTFVLSQVVSICIRVRVTSVFAFIFAFHICITLHKLTFNLGILNFIVAFYESFSW